MSTADLHRLARAAGVAVRWRDAYGERQTVMPDALRHVLAAMALPAGSAAQLRDSLARLRLAQRACPPLVTADQGAPILIPGVFPQQAGFHIALADGRGLSGTASAHADGVLLPAVTEAGYHKLRIGEREITLAVAPPRCPGVDTFCGKNARAWGLAVQLYGLRRKLDPASDYAPAMGDFTALERLLRPTGQAGADVVAISPVHAMFSAQPERYSPYSPSSRLFLNVLYADPAAVFGATTVARAARHLGLGERLLALDARALIDWPELGRDRIALLRELFRGFPDNAPTGAQQDFERFRTRQGEALETHARFEALHARHLDSGATAWQQWPAEFHSPASAAVQAFARRHADEVAFHAFLQWLADDGLRRAQQTALDSGMRIGLIGDLAVGTDPGGSHAWSRQQEIFTGLSPGAPPDLHNPLGQSWGLTAFAPGALRQHGFHAFIEMLRANLAHVRGLRIDHALGMARMWLVPEGATPREGAYVAYPFDDLLRLITLEAWRHQAIILAENLGTVPANFDAAIEARGMLGMSVLWFAREHGADAAFTPRRAWPAGNMATTSTHDLPTVNGWWAQRDLDWRARLDLLGEQSEARQREQRAADSAALWQALKPGEAAGAAPALAPIEAIIDFIGGTPAPLVLLPLEDMVGAVEQANLPGTVETHPNWRRRSDAAIEDIFDTPQTVDRLRILAQARAGSRP